MRVLLSLLTERRDQKTLGAINVSPRWGEDNQRCPSLGLRTLTFLGSILTIQPDPQ